MPHSEISLDNSEIEKAYSELRLEKFKKTFESPDFDIESKPEDIELTDEEKETAINRAKRNKQVKINTEAYWKKVNTPKVYHKFTFDQLSHIVKIAIQKNIPGFIFDYYNEFQFTAICLYFSGDERFLKLGEGYSFSKGLMLFGPVGCGKTTFMRYFLDNQIQSYKMFNCVKISREFAIEGFNMIEKYTNVIKISANNFGHTEYGICFDDLGTDEQRQNYGNKTNIMAEILLDRYSNLRKNLTHVTTNLSTEQIIEAYTERIWSRMREMFNVIIFDKESPDRRK